MLSVICESSNAEKDACFLRRIFLDYLPTYFQACKGASPLLSGVDTFGLSMVLGPIVILTGISVTKLNRYRTQCYIGWAFLILAVGLLSTVSADTSLARTIGFSVLVSVGGGIVYAITYFPVLAPLPVDKNAHALAFFAFCRSFAGVSCAHARSLELA